MPVSLFNAVPAGAIETILDSTNEPLFKRADLGRFLRIVDMRHNFTNIATKSQFEITTEGVLGDPTLGRLKNQHDVFVNLEGALEIVVRSIKPKALSNHAIQRSLIINLFVNFPLNSLLV